MGIQRTSLSLTTPSYSREVYNTNAKQLAVCIIAWRKDVFSRVDSILIGLGFTRVDSNGTHDAMDMDHNWRCYQCYRLTDDSPWYLTVWNNYIGYSLSDVSYTGFSIGVTTQTYTDAVNGAAPANSIGTSWVTTARMIYTDTTFYMMYSWGEVRISNSGGTYVWFVNTGTTSQTSSTVTLTTPNCIGVFDVESPLEVGASKSLIIGGAYTGGYNRAAFLNNSVVPYILNAGVLGGMYDRNIGNYVGICECFLMPDGNNFLTQIKVKGIYGFYSTTTVGEGAGRLLFLDSDDGELSDTYYASNYFLIPTEE